MNEESYSIGLNWQLIRVLFIILFISNFFPFYITIIVFIIELIILASLGSFKKIDSRKITSPYLWIFIAYSLIVSLIYGNYVGALISVAFALFVIYFVFYQEMTRPSFYEELLNFALIGSFILFIFAILEYLNYIPEWDYTFISEQMGLTHNNRVEATFFNPNYYAMMLEFFIIIGIYKITRTKKWRKKIVYSFISLCNLLALLFTGSRTALAVVIVALFVYYYVYGYKKRAILSGVILSLSTVFAYYFNLLPRSDHILYAFEDRFVIWRIAWAGLRDNLWFGQGPLTYMHIWETYGDKYTQHAHNIVLDTLLNYGLIGTSILTLPIYQLMTSLNQMRAFPSLRRRLALICSFITVVLIHGITDVAIFWVQTAILFLFIVLGYKSMIKEKSK